MITADENNRVYFYQLADNNSLSYSSITNTAFVENTLVIFGNYDKQYIDTEGMVVLKESTYNHMLTGSVIKYFFIYL